MKTTPYYYLLVFCSLFFLSCSNESIEESIIQEEEETTDPDVVDEEENTATDPCDFDLSSIAPNSTVTINCVLDLAGETINLPENVNLNFDGGDIIGDGRLVFNGGTIDYRLMSSRLTLEGDVTLQDPVFRLIASRWDIVQGRTTDDISENNKNLLQNLINCVKGMEGNTLSINALDAYFKVDVPLSVAVPQDAAITLPSDFNLIMTDNTHIRMQPNDFELPTLLSVTNENTNVLIEGGNLYGDRDEHDYSSGGTHEFGHLLRLKASSFVTVRGVTFTDATGDAIDVSGLNFSFQPNYMPSHNILITGNTLIRSRRNNISVTSAHDVIIENNEFIDAGAHTALSNGTAPSFAIDVEADRSNGTILEIVEDVIIRNNTERGSRVGAFTVHTGDRVTIEDNILESHVSYSTSIGTVIRNNTLTATTDLNRNNGTAITAGFNERFEANFDNEVSGNTIIGFSTGIKMANTLLEVFDNNVIDCKVGLSLEVITNSEVRGNTVTSTREESDGIVTAGLSKFIDGVTISDNTIEVLRTPFKFVGVNNDPGEENYRFSIENNTVNSTNTSTISSTNGVSFNTNTIDQGGVRFVNAKDCTASLNTIRSTVAHGIELSQGNSDIEVVNNDINITGNYQCFIAAEDGVNIVVNNNNCNL